MRGIVIGAGVSIITVWIPTKGLVNWKDLTSEEIKTLKKNYGI